MTVALISLLCTMIGVKTPRVVFDKLQEHFSLLRQTVIDCNFVFLSFPQKSPALLAKHVLAEIPKQVQEYFSKRGLAPMPPKGPAPPSLGAL